MEVRISKIHNSVFLFLRILIFAIIPRRRANYFARVSRVSRVSRAR
jgi:hypothetical protein